MLVYRLGMNNNHQQGVFELTLSEDQLKNEEVITQSIEKVKKLYFKHRLLGDNDPAKIKQALANRRQK